MLAKLQAYHELRLGAVIRSGYPHRADAELFARHVLSRLGHSPLSSR